MEMNKKLKCVIGLMVVVLMILVFPFDIIREDVECASGGDIAYGMTSPMTMETPFVQTFVAQHGYLEQMAVAFAINDEREKEGTVVVSLADEMGEVISEQEVLLKDVEDCIYYDMEIGKRLKKGAVYQIVFTLRDCNENVPALYYTVHETQHTIGNVMLMFGEQPIDGQVVLRYNYEGRISIGNVLCLWLFIIAMGLMLYELLERRES